MRKNTTAFEDFIYRSQINFNLENSWSQNLENLPEREKCQHSQMLKANQVENSQEYLDFTKQRITLIDNGNADGSVNDEEVKDILD